MVYLAGGQQLGQVRGCIGERSHEGLDAGQLVGAPTLLFGDKLLKLKLYLLHRKH